MLSGNLLKKSDSGNITSLQEVGMPRRADGMMTQMQAETLFDVSLGLHFPCSCGGRVA
jgi:hypothetical protein